MEIILKYFPDLSPRQIEQISALEGLYRYWNERINVISRKDIDSLYLHHVLHSLGIARIFTPVSGTTFLDAGTGGGFPGIPLAILWPEATFLLSDSIGKKIKVVDMVSGELKLDNVSSMNARVENIPGMFDFVVSRAVRDLRTLYPWVRNKILKTRKNSIANGLLYLKGGDLSDELKTLKVGHKIYSLSACFEEPWFESKLLVHLFDDF